MNITHELLRTLQVNSCANTASDAARDVFGQVFGTRRLSPAAHKRSTTPGAEWPRPGEGNQGRWTAFGGRCRGWWWVIE
jgi:hypothetical protein